MAIVLTELIRGSSSTDNQPTYTTASITPATDGSPIILMALMSKASGTPPVVSSMVGNNLTWTAIHNTTQRDNGVCAYRISVFKGIGTAATGTNVLTMSSSTATSVLWQFVQLAGVDTVAPLSTTNKIESTSTSAAVSTSLTLPNTPATTSAVLGYIGHNAFTEDITAGTDFTKGTNTSTTNPSSSWNHELKTANVNTTVDASWSTSAGFVAGGIEVIAAASGSPLGFIPI